MTIRLTDVYFVSKAPMGKPVSVKLLMLEAKRLGELTIGIVPI